MSDWPKEPKTINDEFRATHESLNKPFNLPAKEQRKDKPVKPDNTGKS
jgi:hypothetical protein